MDDGILDQFEYDWLDFFLRTGQANMDCNPSEAQEIARAMIAAGMSLLDDPPYDAMNMPVDTSQPQRR